MTNFGGKLPVWACLAFIMLGAQAGFSADAALGTAKPGARWELPASIPVGPASDNPQTSQAVSALIHRSAAAYVATQAMHASGDYVGLTKTDDGGTSHLTAKVTLNYEAPGKLSVRTVGETSLHTTAFVANGTTVSMEWGSNTTTGVERLYFTMPQPDSLSAYTADRRRGELYKDRADVLGMAVMPQLLVSEDPLEVYRSNVTDYVYEGSEAVAGRQCHRIQFRQTSPKAVVILWIDAESYLVQKSSIIKSFDDSYQMVESFEEGTYAEMMIMAWNQMTTDSAQVAQAEFEWSVPADGRMDEAKEPDSLISLIMGEEEPTLWQSLVASAAESSSQQTTFSLSRQQGSASVELHQVVELDSAPMEIETRRLPGEKHSTLILAMKDGTVRLRDYDGREKGRFSLGMKPAAFDCMETTTGELLYVLALDENKEKLVAFDLTGKKAWEYSYPFATILSFDAGVKEPCVYVSLDSNLGLRKLNAEGEVDYSARVLLPVPRLTALAPHTGAPRLVGYWPGETVVYDETFVQQDHLETDANVMFARWDEKNPDAPYITFSVSSESDALVQRRRPSGDVVWTVIVAPKQEDLRGGATVPMNLRIDGALQRVWLTVTSRGHIVLTGDSGSILFRGHMTADPATVERNGGSVINHVTIGDLSGDGAEELYLKLDTHLLRFTTVR